jgi:molybdate transport system ATP-binding protein
LLDEPFAALDKALRHRLRQELKELQEQLRIPLLLITHDDEDLRVLADDVVHLHGGRVVAAEEPA